MARCWVSRNNVIRLEGIVKTYRIVYTGGVMGLVLTTILALSVVGLPLAVVLLPTMYQIVAYERGSTPT